MLAVKPQSDFQSTFKVQIAPDPSDLFNNERQFHTRKTHRKSRGGCQSCKKRRVKCDEAKPSCDRCSRADITCNYNHGETSVVKRSRRAETRSPTPGFEMNSMAVDLISLQLEDLLGPISQFDFADDSTSSVRILQHFQTVTSSTIGGPSVQNVMHSFVANRAWDHPYLMHMALAVSAAHMKRLLSDQAQPERQHLIVAEADHGQSGLQLWQRQVESRDFNIDAAVATTFLTSIFTFALNDDDDQINGNATREDIMTEVIEPLAALGGYRALRSALPAFDPSKTAWAGVLSASDDDEGTFTNTAPGIDGIPRAFVELCGLDKNSNGDNNPYHRTVRLLTPLLRLDANGDHCGKLLAFCGRVWPQLRPLIFQMDPIALVLLSYWIACLGRIDQWWLTNRARKGCRILVSYLSNCPDPKIQDLLSFPASFGTFDLPCMF